MSNIAIALLAYLINRFFGDFKFANHPLVIIGEVITFFQERFYKDNISRGFLLVMFVIATVSFASIAIFLYLNQINELLNISISSLIASLFLTRTMLYYSLKEASSQPKDLIKTYAKKPSQELIAPLFYLLLFGIVGIIVYKTADMMNSMLISEDKKGEQFSKPSALLNEILNYIPLKITSLLIMGMSRQSRFLK